MIQLIVKKTKDDLSNNIVQNYFQLKVFEKVLDNYRNIFHIFRYNYQVKQRMKVEQNKNGETKHEKENLVYLYTQFCSVADG